MRTQKTGKIRAAKLENSPRLQRIYARLQEGPATTRELILDACACAINTAIDELRDPINNIPISCRPIGKGVYQYRLERLF